MDIKNITNLCSAVELLGDAYATVSAASATEVKNISLIFPVITGTSLWAAGLSSLPLSAFDDVSVLTTTIAPCALGL